MRQVQNQICNEAALLLDTIPTFHPKVKILKRNFAAGLLAFHITEAFPLALTRTVAKGVSKYSVDYSCGDSSGLSPAFPINLRTAVKQRKNRKSEANIGEKV